MVKNMRTRITQRDIPSLAEGTYSIGSGLYLRKRGEYANYFLRITVSGRRRDIAIGSAREFTLAIAKSKAEQIRAKVKSGTYEFKKESKDKSVITFGEYWEEGLRVMAKARSWSDHTIQCRTATIRLHALPFLRDIPLNQIDRETLLGFIIPISENSWNMGRRLRALLEALFSLAIVQGHMQTNPATWKGNLELFVPKNKSVKVRHMSALSFEETAQLLSKLLQLPDRAYARLTILVILTAMRSGEIRSLKWTDIDLEAGIINIKDEHMKVKRGFDRRIPMSTQLIELVKVWKEMPKREYVCSSTRSNETIDPPSALISLKQLVATFSDSPATVHGFRSTFTDWCAEHEEPVEVVEMALDHLSGSEVRRAYFRSDLFDLRKGLLQRYSDAIFEEMKKHI